MIIQDINIKDLTMSCVDLLMKTYTELGQTPSEQVVLLMSQSLAQDLKKRFKDLELYDVEAAFSRGVRETDDFSINVKTYFKWLTFWKKQVIDAATYEVRTMQRPKREIPYYIEKEQHKQLLITKKEDNDKN